MKRIVCVLACTAAALCGADLASVRTVYVMPMSRGMDQYLANRLSAERVFKIVSDPKLADAVFTDSIGQDLTSSLDDFFPAEPAAKKDSKDAKNSDPKDSKDSDPKDSKGSTTFVNSLDNPASSSTFGRAKGVFFLVDAKTRQVVWSTFEAPRRFDSKRLDSTASDIVSRLKRDLKQGAASPKETPTRKTPQPPTPK